MPRLFATACLGLAGSLALAACDTGPGKDVTEFASTLGTDSCGAVSHQYLVGRSVAHLNVTELPANTRVVPVGTSPGTSENPKRMSVIIGGGDEVTRVYCG